MITNIAEDDNAEHDVNDDGEYFEEDAEEEFDEATYRSYVDSVARAKDEEE
jgi:hypothetical protein